MHWRFEYHQLGSALINRKDCFSLTPGKEKKNKTKALVQAADNKTQYSYFAAKVSIDLSLEVHCLGADLEEDCANGQSSVPSPFLLPPFAFQSCSSFWTDLVKVIG